jgi:hypothetical protein
MSKAAVGFLIQQVAFEEPEITAVGISPGLCDTKMVGGLLKGECTLQSRFLTTLLSILHDSFADALKQMVDGDQRRLPYIKSS